MNMMYIIYDAMYNVCTCSSKTKGSNGNNPQKAESATKKRCGHNMFLESAPRTCNKYAPAV